MYEQSVHLIEVQAQEKFERAQEVEIQLARHAPTDQVSKSGEGERPEESRTREIENAECPVVCESEPWVRVVPQLPDTECPQHRGWREVLHVQPAKQSCDAPVRAPPDVTAPVAAPKPARECQSGDSRREVGIDLRCAKDYWAARQQAQRHHCRVEPGQTGSAPPIDDRSEQRNDQDGQHRARPDRAAQTKRYRHQEAETWHVLRPQMRPLADRVRREGAVVYLVRGRVVVVVVSDVEVAVAHHARRRNQVVRFVARDRKTAGLRRPKCQNGACSD